MMGSTTAHSLIKIYVVLGIRLLGITFAQQPGDVVKEEAPEISIEKCTKAGGCQKVTGGLVLDANWRWVHNKNGYESCFSKKGWSKKWCKTEEECKENCALEGVDAKGYEKNYGVKATDGGKGVELQFSTKGGNVGSRLYVTEKSGESYMPFHLLNREFTLDVDVATLGCGTNGAVYFVEMDMKGGLGTRGNNAGAKFGTGYCDAQCPNEKMVWNKSNGICCVEMDIWEANNKATAFTPHPCSTVGPKVCKGNTDCGYGDNGERYLGLCDKDGCDYNTYRMGQPNFYGPGNEFKVNSLRPMTVVTQFITSDGTDSGALTEIRRIYVQDGKVIENAKSIINGSVHEQAVNDHFCNDQKAYFNDTDHHQAKGGLASMGEALHRGMVLALSVWDDFSTNMTWLDSSFPPHRPRSDPGVARGPCEHGEGHPKRVRKSHKDAYVKYYNIKIGEIGSTYTSGGGRRLRGKDDVFI